MGASAAFLSALFPLNPPTHLHITKVDLLHDHSQNSPPPAVQLGFCEFGCDFVVSLVDKATIREDDDEERAREMALSMYTAVLQGLRIGSVLYMGCKSVVRYMWRV